MGAEGPQGAPADPGRESGSVSGRVAAMDTAPPAAPTHPAPASADGPRDPLHDKLQSLIDGWFSEAKDHQPSLSHYAEIQEGLLSKASAQANESALRNALQWSSSGGDLALALAPYDANATGLGVA